MEPDVEEERESLLAFIDSLIDKCNTFANVMKLTDFPSKSKNIILKRKNTTHPNCLSLDNNTTDIALIVNNQKINAHKVVLSSNSAYFNCMFTSGFKEQDQDEVKINITDISYETLKTLIEYLYQSKLFISEQNVQELLIGSNILLLEDVSKSCVDYLKTITDVENCISIKNLADSLCLSDLYIFCLTFIINNFRLVADHEMFMTVSNKEIMIFIKDDNLCANELMVYDVVMKWIKHDPLTRSKYLVELLWYVRLPLVLNTYQGVTNVQDFPSAKIDRLSDFRKEHRKPFRKGILVLGHNPKGWSLKWYDAGLDQWRGYCNYRECYCKKYQTILAPLQNLCSCALLDDGRLFAVGGSLRERGLISANIFDPKTKAWSVVSDMCYPRVRPYVVQIGTKVYVIGGCSELVSHSTNLGRIEYYDLKTNTWVLVAYSFRGLSCLRNDTFVTSVNDLIYIIGRDKAGFFNPHEHFWCPIPDLPEKREDAAVCTLNNSVYIIGGRYQGNCLKSVWSYCTETYVWTALAEMNSPRSHSGAVVMNGLIYVFGGKRDGERFSDTFEVYHPYRNKWEIPNATMTVSNTPNECDIDAFVIDKNCMLFEEVLEGLANNVYH